MLLFTFEIYKIKVWNYILKQNEKSMAAHKKSSEAHLLRNTEL